MERTAWNALVRRFAPPFGGFLQSWEWGEFQSSLGREVTRLHEERDGKTMLAQVVTLPLPFRAEYASVSKGPLGDMPKSTVTKVLREAFPDAAFVRYEPSRDGARLQVKEAQPATTSRVDLTRGWDTVLVEMKQKTRYNVRLAEKKGVTVRLTGVECFDDFVRLLEQTAVRDAFSLHPNDYYQSMLEHLQSGELRVFLAFADYQGRPIAASLMLDWHDERIYLHGASSNLHRNVMAPYMLHAFLMQEAMEKGLKVYDFWGVAPIGSSESHPWFGVTRFKLGFGGETVRMPGTFDLPITWPMYALYRTAKIFQKKKKRTQAV